ncbi:hypothetical protein M0813_06469 [Anaeramoeba flamelloides]|uniref:SCP2 domain-containing protein n=1 Tax=Anaeramoeba flamelloides TaxID=1746091 RepID=A0ABQ8XEA3_9EUKA|nr:hypothetical protein M0813_06469 [Anaeramoeba flamelloides]
MENFSELSSNLQTIIKYIPFSYLGDKTKTGTFHFVITRADLEDLKVSIIVSEGTAKVVSGHIGETNTVVKCDDNTLLSLFTGEVDPTVAMMFGQIQVNGDLSNLVSFAQMFDLSRESFKRYQSQPQKAQQKCFSNSSTSKPLNENVNENEKEGELTNNESTEEKEKDQDKNKKLLKLPRSTLAIAFRFIVWSCTQPEFESKALFQINDVDLPDIVLNLNPEIVTVNELGDNTENEDDKDQQEQEQQQQKDGNSKVEEKDNENQEKKEEEEKKEKENKKEENKEKKENEKEKEKEKDNENQEKEEEKEEEEKEEKKEEKEEKEEKVKEKVKEKEDQDQEKQPETADLKSNSETSRDLIDEEYMVVFKGTEKIMLQYLTGQVKLLQLLESTTREEFSIWELESGFAHVLDETLQLTPEKYIQFLQEEGDLIQEKTQKQGRMKKLSTKTKILLAKGVFTIVDSVKRISKSESINSMKNGGKQMMNKVKTSQPYTTVSEKSTKMIKRIKNSNSYQKATQETKELYQKIRQKDLGKKASKGTKQIYKSTKDGTKEMMNKLKESNTYGKVKKESGGLIKKIKKADLVNKFVMKRKVKELQKKKKLESQKTKNKEQTLKEKKSDQNSTESKTDNQQLETNQNQGYELPSHAVFDFDGLSFLQEQEKK